MTVGVQLHKCVVILWTPIIFSYYSRLSVSSQTFQDQQIIKFIFHIFPDLCRNTDGATSKAEQNHRLVQNNHC